MANVALLWDKPSDRGTLSGGSWLAGLPLANVQEPDVQRVARSASASPAHTRFRVDLGTARPAALSMFVLLNHNITPAGRWRIVATADAADADPAQRVLDTGLLPVWVPTVVFGAQPWGVLPWDGNDASAYPSGTVAFHLLRQPVVARYLWVYVDDAANPAGFVQAGRFLAGQAWSPQVNASYGAAIRWVDAGEARRTRGGRRIVRTAPRYRQFDLQFEALTEAEAMGIAFEVSRQLGKEGDFFLVLDPEAEGSVRFRQSIYAALTDTAPIPTPYFDTWTWSLSAEELI